MSESRANRLAAETSPYLLQHRHNPVDWYPWGPEAFAAAERLNRPIFLSVGYSTCYWCHVMERESFENEAVAAVMNDRFINIKVDREERPDVDQVYMTAVQLLTRQGGWPMSMFLTPDRRPFYGGTYFPPTDGHGRPGFVSLLGGISDAYQNRRGEVEQSADQLVTVLRQVAEPDPPRGTVVIDDTLVDRLIRRSSSDYDARLGGYGGAPKFARQTLLELLLVHNRTHPDDKRMNQLRHTLDAMLHGGIRDQLGGGFHRYSTDAEWLVPHFEIMLYDNAMLGWCYAEAFGQTGDDRYSAAARGIFDFVLSDMTSPDGAFYTAFDAEVDAQEGKSYLWTRSELEATLAEALGDAPTAEGRIHEFCQVYGLDDGPNFADPHHGNGMPDQNILFVHHPMVDGGPAVLDAGLAELRSILLRARKQRKQPSLDTKIITSWNGLMIRALAHGGRVLNESRYVDAAAKGADFLLARHRTDDGLYRTSRDGVAKYAGFLDDYAFLIQSLLALHEATADARWKESAQSLATQMLQKFHDPAGGYYFTDGVSDDVPVRQKVGTDSPLPSGNGVAALACLTLGKSEIAADTLVKFAGTIQSHGEGMSALVLAAAEYVRAVGPLTVSAGPSTRSEKPPIVTLAAKRADDGLIVTARIADGYHINSHEPPAGLIATALAGDGIVDVQYPDPEMIPVGFIDQPLPVYSGVVRFVVRPAVPSVTLRYQACDANACQAPATVMLQIS